MAVFQDNSWIMATKQYATLQTSCKIWRILLLSLFLLLLRSDYGHPWWINTVYPVSPEPLRDMTLWNHYPDVIMGAMASQITSLMIVYSSVHSGADQRKHQSSASLAFVRGIHRWPAISPHKGPVTRKIFPFDDVIILLKKTTRRNSEHNFWDVLYNKLCFTFVLVEILCW